MKDDSPACCRNVLSLCDGYGCSFGAEFGNPDNTQFCCMLKKGHTGPHYDEFKHDGQAVVIVWHSEPFRVAVASEED